MCLSKVGAHLCPSNPLKNWALPRSSNVNLRHHDCVVCLFSKQLLKKMVCWTWLHWFARNCVYVWGCYWYLDADSVKQCHWHILIVGEQFNDMGFYMSPICGLSPLKTSYVWGALQGLALFPQCLISLWSSFFPSLETLPRKFGEQDSGSLRKNVDLPHVLIYSCKCNFGLFLRIQLIVSGHLYCM